MKRRNFLAGIGPLAVAPIIGYAKPTGLAAENQQYLEILKYTLPSGDNKGRTEKYYADAAIPALNKLGINNIGVFNVMYGPNNPTLYVIIPHDNMESVLAYQEKLLQDSKYVSSAEDFLEATISAPAYIRMDRGLMKAFAGMPQVASPKASMGDQRIMELRIYESPNYLKGQSKIDMFNTAGEIQIFKDTGLTPVFFGETIFGTLMPDLTYMVVFKDMTERDKNWAQFVKSPAWDAIKNLPEYKDTVSNITDIILRPAGCSQL